MAHRDEERVVDDPTLEGAQGAPRGMPRVLFLLGAFPVLSETFILYQITGLIDRGHDVRVVTQHLSSPGTGATHAAVAEYGLDHSVVSLLPADDPAGDDDSPARVLGRKLRTARHLLPGATVALATSPRKALPLMRPPAPSPLSRPSSLLQRLALLRYSRTFEPDVVHVHFGYIGLEFLHATYLWRETPLVVSFHGFDCTAFPREHGPHVYDELFARAALITANTENARKHLVALGCPPEKIRIQFDGAHFGDIQYEPRTLDQHDDLRLVTVARLADKKGLRYAIEAMPAVRRRYPTVSYEIVGDGPLKGELERLTEQLDLQNVVTFHGARDARFVRDTLASSHIFVLPSVTPATGDQEGEPVSLMEAMAAGLPVVSTLHGGIPELIENTVTGLLVDERDSVALADAIIHLADHPETWGRMTEAARAHVVATHDIEVLNDRLIEIYDEARRLVPGT